MARENMVVFTFKSVKEILQTGGTQGWVLDPARAKHCDYVVLCRNSRKGNEREPHRAAFMVGHVSGVVPATGRDGRWLVTFDQYALVGVPDVWKQWRNPVRYEPELPFDFEKLAFLPMPEIADSVTDDGAPLPGASRALTIEEAKRGLAAMFGVKPESVEITIRG